MLAVLIVLSIPCWRARLGGAGGTAPRPVAHLLRVVLLTIALPTFVGFFPTVVFVLAVCLAVALRIWPAVRPRVPTFLPFAALSVAVAYGLASAIALRTWPGTSGAREVPLRVDGGPRTAPSPVARLTPVSADVRELHLEQGLAEYRNRTRERMLRQLHEERVQVFASSPGFGVARMFLPSEWGLHSASTRRCPTSPRWVRTPRPAPRPRPATSRTYF